MRFCLVDYNSLMYQNISNLEYKSYVFGSLFLYVLTEHRFIKILFCEIIRQLLLLLSIDKNSNDKYDEAGQTEIVKWSGSADIFEKNRP